MKLDISIDDKDWKSVADLRKLCRRAISEALPDKDIQLSVLFTGDAEISQLNGQWRGKPQPTNVLSFPVNPNLPRPEGEPRPLGDLALAYGVIAKEAAEQDKPIANHISHLIVHGVLHLLGYDHGNDREAESMEGLEVKILNRLGIDNPYQS